MKNKQNFFDNQYLYYQRYRELEALPSQLTRNSTMYETLQSTVLMFSTSPTGILYFSRYLAVISEFTQHSHVHLCIWSLVFPPPVFSIPIFIRQVFSPPFFSQLGLFSAVFIPARSFPLLFYPCPIFHRSLLDKDII